MIVCTKPGAPVPGATGGVPAQHQEKTDDESETENLPFAEWPETLPFAEWMLESAYTVASLLPTDGDEALAVLALAQQIVLKVNKPFLDRLRSAQEAQGDAVP